MNDCVFCERINKGQYDRSSPSAVSFEPLNPVVPGHVLVIPKFHISDASEGPYWASHAMRLASIIAKGMDSCNIITSKGSAATQTIMHMHIHIVPRREGDGLHLPWMKG